VLKSTSIDAFTSVTGSPMIGILTNVRSSTVHTSGPIKLDLPVGRSDYSKKITSLPFFSAHNTGASWDVPFFLTHLTLSVCQKLTSAVPCTTSTSATTTSPSVGLTEPCNIFGKSNPTSVLAGLWTRSTTHLP